MIGRSCSLLAAMFAVLAVRAQLATAAGTALLHNRSMLPPHTALGSTAFVSVAWSTPQYQPPHLLSVGSV